jgi:hypothetical protein
MRFSGSFVVFDGMTWPNPHKMGDLAWKLTHGKPSKEDLLVAASTIEAYTQMVSDPREKRQRVIRVLRGAAQSTTDKGDE